MKYLSSAERTRHSLQRWAGLKKLVFAQFFFWNSGSQFQRSLEGLYRAMLWEVLRACPKLTSTVSSSLWDQNALDHRGKHFPLTLPWLKHAFDMMIQDSRMLQGHRFCFFIDGLDEYDGDHWKLSKSLKEWGVSQNVKICVSSRPYNEFEQSFSAHHSAPCNYTS